MIYKVIGIMSGSSLDGLDIAYVYLHESGGKWEYEIINAECYEYTIEWRERLLKAPGLSALDYQLLDSEYGYFIGTQINGFIEKYSLHHNVHLIASHGHTVFHFPEKRITHQAGSGATIAAITQLPVVSDLRIIDVALGGQGAPIVPIGEKLLLNQYYYFLNIGGIANLSVNDNGKYIAFDVCAANRILNMLANENHQLLDDEGRMAASGSVNNKLLEKLNQLDYYGQAYPKSLPNTFGTDTVYPLVKQAGLSIEDALCTYVEHIAMQVQLSLQQAGLNSGNKQMLITGGGALNIYLIDRLTTLLAKNEITVVIPDKNLIQYKEALIMALIGTLRWREESNTLASVTGAKYNSIGGALWLGAEG